MITYPKPTLYSQLIVIPEDLLTLVFSSRLLACL